MEIILVTGSGGLIGSESVRYFCKLGYTVVGIDNDMRQVFFGKEASTDWNVQSLIREFGDRYKHHQAHIRDQDSITEIFN